MEPFDPNPPEWAITSVHARQFCCPTCQRLPKEAQGVWLNRRSPVYIENRRRKWQEFYHCECGTAWWAWSSDRPPSEFTGRKFVDET